MKRIVLTALNDNNKIYYDNLIPFILSIKETDYEGDIGIIDYGLSQDKKEVLKANNLLLFSPSKVSKELLLDRHISASDIAQQYKYDQISVYDCDIWFPSEKLTIFKQIKDQEKLCATYDPWACSFLYTCIHSEYKDVIGAKLQQLIEQQGYSWQAALLVGDKLTWQNYRNYIVKQLEQGYFKEEYGIDSTILNLYQYDSNNLQFIHQKYNCIPVCGIENRRRVQGKWGYYYQNKLIEGLHITRNHRDDTFLSYKKVKSDHYFQEGKRLATNGQTTYSLVKESIAVFKLEEQHITLELVSAQANGGHFFTKIEESGEVFRKGALWIEVAGESRFVLKNPHAETVRLVYLCQSIPAYEPCSKFGLLLGKGSFSPELNSIYFIDLAPYKTLEFYTQELDLQGKRLRWIFDNVRLI